MATRSVLTQSFVIQSIGAGLGLLVVIIVAQRFGPAVQGTFATARAWVDMASLVLLAGLPQALIHEVSSERLSAGAGVRLALAFAGAGILLLWAATAAIEPLSPPFDDARVRAMLVGAACLATVHGLLRIFALTSRQFLIYNLITAAPAGLLVLGVVLSPIANPTSIALILLTVFAGCSVMAAVAVRALLFARVTEPLAPLQVLRLAQYGGWSFAQQVAAQGAILGSYLILRMNGSEAAGYFSVAMVLVSVMTLPLNFVGPILLNRWVADYAASRSTSHFASAACGFLLLAIAGTIVGLPAIYLGIPLVFGEEFVSALPACLAIGASTVLLVQRRVLSTAGLAFGMPGYCAVAEVARVVVTLAVAGVMPTLGGAITGWCAGELVGLALIAATLRKKLRLSFLQLLGVDRAAATQLLQHTFRRQPVRLP